MFKDLTSLVKELEAEREARFKELLVELCSKALAVALFGSRARGDNTPLSDWDLLAIVETGEYKVESTSVGQILWLPLDKVGEVLECSMIILDAIMDARLLCGDVEVLRRVKGEALRYIEKRGLTRTRAGWVPLK